MGQGCIVLLVDQFAQQKDAVSLRGLEHLPLNVIDNPVISAVFLPQFFHKEVPLSYSVDCKLSHRVFGLCR